MCQLSQVLTTRGGGRQADSIGHLSESCLEQMPSGHTFQRVDDGVLSLKGSLIPVLVVGVAGSPTQFAQQGSNHSALACGFRAMNYTILTRGSVWLWFPLQSACSVYAAEAAEAGGAIGRERTGGVGNLRLAKWRESGSEIDDRESVGAVEIQSDQTLWTEIASKIGIGFVSAWAVTEAGSSTQY